MTNNPNPSNQPFVSGTCNIVITPENQQSYLMTFQVLSVEPECYLPTVQIQYFDPSGNEISENDLISRANGMDGGLE